MSEGPVWLGVNLKVCKYINLGMMSDLLYGLQYDQQQKKSDPPSHEHEQNHHINT